MIEIDIEKDTKVFGFWVYLMTDLVIFAVLFAVFVVMRANTAGGPSGFDLFDMNTVIAETLILLTSSFTCSLGTLSVFKQKKTPAIIWFALTCLLGLSFLYLEISEFHDFIKKGDDWQRSGFLSSFFTLVSTHGFHVSMGLLWMIVAMIRIAIRPYSGHGISQIYRMAFFWHFLDFVWIFIFTVVYGMELLHA